MLLCVQSISSTVEYDSIYSVIAQWTTNEVAGLISQGLHTHFQSTSVQVNRFRASVVFSSAVMKFSGLLSNILKNPVLKGLDYFNGISQLQMNAVMCMLYYA